MIKGYLPEEIIGKHLSIFYAPEDAAQGRPQALLEAARKEGRVEDEGWRVRKDGTRFWADVVITAIVAEGAFRGFIEGYLGFDRAPEDRGGTAAAGPGARSHSIA